MKYSASLTKMSMQPNSGTNRYCLALVVKVGQGRHRGVVVEFSLNASRVACVVRSGWRSDRLACPSSMDAIKSKSYAHWATQIEGREFVEEQNG